MDQEARMSQLYDKMAAEQAKYRGWLLEQPPEEIVSHAYEYAMREDVLMAMEDMELQPEQAEVLLASASPLDDVYQVFSKMETPHMDTIRECIETQADALLLAQRDAPLYRQPASYAREHGELEQYRASLKANIACKQAIETAIRENFDGMHMNEEAVRRTLAAYGPERTSFVLASTIQMKDWDERFSPANKEWAIRITVSDPEERRCAYSVESHPAVLDGFIRQVRESLEPAREQPARVDGKPSIRAQLAANLAQTARPAPEARDKGAR